MGDFTRLLAYVAEGGHDLAVRYAARLVTATGAHLTLVDVVEEVPALVRKLLPRSWNVPGVVREQKQAHLDRVAARAVRLGVRPKISLLRGSPVRALVDEVRRGRHDLLIAGAASAEAVRAMGTTAVRLVRECPCPVLLVHDARPRRRPQVLVAVDTGPWRLTNVDVLTARLLEIGLRFAEQQGGDLHVLHVWDDHVERFLRRGGLQDTEIKHFIVQAREQARRELEHAITPVRSRIADRRIHLERGDPRKAIAAFASHHRMDLLVIGTVGRSGLAARIVGNTAEAVLSALPCSLLVVRPEPVRKRGRSTRTGPGSPRARAEMS